jgi:hypothetical protein
MKSSGDGLPKVCTRQNQPTPSNSLVPSVLSTQEIFGAPELRANTGFLCDFLFNVRS